MRVFVSDVRSCVSLNACFLFMRIWENGCPGYQLCWPSQSRGHLLTLSFATSVCGKFIATTMPLHVPCEINTQTMAGSFVNSDLNNESQMSKCWPVPKKLTWTNMTGALARGWFNANRESSYWNVMSDFFFSPLGGIITICLYIKCWNYFFFPPFKISLWLNNRVP